ncbi:MAG: MBL fold metallo-hydrolase [Anaerolineae bacterium]
MEITWYGHACFRLKEDKATIITDPYSKELGLTLPRLSADIVTVSHAHPHHSEAARLKGAYRRIDGPGEYEIRGIFITATAMYPPNRQYTSQEEAVNDQNIVYVYQLDRIKICHLGDMRHVPTQSQVETLEDVDVLFVPVGGGRTLNAAKAAEVISLIEPSIAIPMHYALPGMTLEMDSLDKFLKEMGVSDGEGTGSLKLSKAKLPEETQVVVLNCAGLPA